MKIIAMSVLIFFFSWLLILTSKSVFLHALLIKAFHALDSLVVTQHSHQDQTLPQRQAVLSSRHDRHIALDLQAFQS